MSAYTLTKDTNIRDLTVAGGYSARTNTDTIATAGWTFTQDQDNRYGLGANTSAVWGSLTITAATGGQLNFDGRYVRMIPFTAGSGTITAGATITCGSATGVVIGIYASLTTAPVLTGVATGWIKVTAWNSIAFPTSGTFTQGGYTFTISGASTVGFIEVNGVEANTINANRLGSVNVTGEWYEVGTTNGTSNQTMQIPNNGLTCWHAGVFIEKTVGSGDFEFWGNAGTTTTTGTEAARGKVVWIDANGLVRIGNSGAATNGYTPVTGLRVVIGNVFFNNVVTTLTANVIPNATIATRYDFTTTGGGVVSIDKCSMGWYLSCAQAYSVNVSNSGFVDGILLSEIATPMTFTKVGVGNKPTTALTTLALTMSYCFAGGTFTESIFNRVAQAASGAHVVSLTDITGFTFNNCVFRANTIRGNATTYSNIGTRMKNCIFNNHQNIGGGAESLTTCDNVTYNNTVYINCVSGTTVTTYATSVWALASNTINCTFNGLTFGGLTNVQPYASILSQATGCANNKLRNIGTRAVPLSLGSTNACGLIHTLATGCFDTKIQRVYVSNTRTGIMTGDNSSKGLIQENVFGDYADAVDVAAVINMTNKGMGGTGALTAQTSVYGTHWQDGFTSTTAGRISIVMNEATAETTSQVTLANGSAFTSAGGLYMPVIGHTVTFEMPEYVIGHTGFANSALVMAGGTATNYNYNYAIDKNDGNGWSVMTTANYTATTLGTALNGITGINAQLGFKLRLKITTTVTNTTAITSVYITTISTTTAQDYQYPLDKVLLEFTDLKTGSEIRAYVGTDPATSTEIGGTDSSGTTFSFTHANGGQAGYIQVFALGYTAITLPITYSSIDQSIPIQQQVDRWYSNPV